MGQGDGAHPGPGDREVALSIERLYTYAAWADKWDGAVHHTPFWVNYGKPMDWADGWEREGEEFLRHATQVKNIWIPYGE